MKTYRGQISGGQCSVTVDGQPLRMIYPKGNRWFFPFEWGIESPGSEHLAQAILFDCVAETAMRRLGRAFMIQHVSRLPTLWTIQSNEIEKWVKIRVRTGHSVQKTCFAAPGSEAPPPPAQPLRSSDFPTFPVDPLKRNRPKALAPDA